MNDKIEVVESQGRLASVDNAVKTPLDFQVSFDILGWSLRYIDSDFSTLISQGDAELVIEAIQLARTAP